MGGTPPFRCHSSYILSDTWHHTSAVSRNWILSGMHFLSWSLSQSTPPFVYRLQEKAWLTLSFKLVKHKSPRENFSVSDGRWDRSHLAANHQVVVNVTDAGNGGAVRPGVDIDAEEHHSHKDDGAVQVAGRKHCLPQQHRQDFSEGRQRVSAESCRALAVLVLLEILCQMSNAMGSCNGES